MLLPMILRPLKSMRVLMSLPMPTASGWITSAKTALKALKTSEWLYNVTNSDLEIKENNEFKPII